MRSLAAFACLGSFAVTADARVPELPSPLESALLAVAKYSVPDTYSGLIETSSGPVAVFAYGTPEKIDVWSYGGGSWRKATTLDIGCCEIGGPPPAGSFTVLPLADLPSNLTVPIDFPTRPSDLAVLAERGGSWQLVPFLAPGQPPANFVGTGGATVSGATIVAEMNNCLPDCANGQLSKTVWSYDSLRHGFTTAVASVAASPPPRAGAALTYDDATGQLVMFGGAGTGKQLEDTWTWDGSAWHPAYAPGPDGGTGTLVFDQHARQLLLVQATANGSGNDSDTWLWGGTGWTRLLSASNPPSYGEDVAAYDAATGEVVLLVEGGVPTYNLGTETWLWNGQAWTQAHPQHSPPVSTNEPLAYDPVGQQVILQGSGGLTPTGFGTPNTDTWAWNGSDWTRLAPRHHPTESANAAMTYDPNKSKAWLVDTGGSVDPGCPLGPGPRQASVWSWNGHDWAMASAPSGLALHEGAAIGYDAATKQLVLFGGCDYKGMPTGGTDVLDGPQPNQVPEPAKPGGGGKCDSLIDSGFSAQYEPQWVKTVNDNLKEKANELAKGHGLPIPFGQVTLPAGLALNFEPQFEPFNAQVCAIGLGGMLKGPLWTAPSDQFSLGLTAGSSPLSGVTYAADVGGWTSAPDAPPGQNLSTVWLPGIHVVPGPAVGFNSKDLNVELDLGEIDLASVKAKWPLVVRGSQVLEVQLGPTLALVLDVRKKDLVDELAKKIKELNDSPNPPEDAVKTAEQDVAGEVSEDMAAEVQSFETGYLRVTMVQDLASGDATLIIDSIEQTIESELASEVSLLQAGTADAAEFASQSVTAADLGPDAAAALEGSAGGDAVLGGGRLLCVAIAGGPEDIFGDIFCAVI